LSRCSTLRPDNQYGINERGPTLDSVIDQYLRTVRLNPIAIDMVVARIKSMLHDREDRHDPA